MKVTLNILLIVGCCSALVFSKGVDNGSKKSVKTSSLISMGSIKFTHDYGQFTTDEDTIERKRSHKRRKAVRKPRRGRGQ
jgi:ABC-type lipoprotein release transport system permease subunit